MDPKPIDWKGERRSGAAPKGARIVGYQAVAFIDPRAGSRWMPARGIVRAV